MKSRPYLVIFSLLTISVLAVLLLQVFWIRNFYIQKRDEFDKSVYAVLEKINARLEERQNLKVIQQDLQHQLNARKPSLKNNTVILKKSNTTLSYASVNANPGKQTNSFIRIETGNGRVEMQSHDTVLKALVSENVLVDKGKRSVERNIIKTAVPGIVINENNITIKTDSTNKLVNTIVTVPPKPEKSEGDIAKLMDKILMEIKIVDTDETNADTLRSIIQRTLENKGIFLPFEFSLKKLTQDKPAKILAQSAGYDSTKTAYRGDLSANKVFTTHNFLFLQFPDVSGVVMKGMKNIIILSLFFSLLIIAMFYYSMRLIIKQKKLSDVKNDFMNNMTHELKTPIATLSLAIDAISNPLIKSNEERFHSYMQVMKEENNKLNTHVERVLQIALLDKGELILKKSLVDLKQAVLNAIKSYQLQIKHRQIELLTNLEEQTLAIYGDEFHLQTAFGNLIDNAIKYSEEGARIEIKLNKENHTIYISVKDNGIGIASEQHRKVFEKFYRVQGGDVHDVKGFGLGLSYVKSIIEKHGGNIELISEEGKGSEFTIKLPTHES